MTFDFSKFVNDVRSMDPDVIRQETMGDLVREVIKTVGPKIWTVCADEMAKEDTPENVAAIVNSAIVACAILAAATCGSRFEETRLRASQLFDENLAEFFSTPHSARTAVIASVPFGRHLLEDDYSKKDGEA